MANNISYIKSRTGCTVNKEGLTYIYDGQVLHDQSGIELGKIVNVRELIKAYREVVLTAVSQDGGALQYADEALQLDPLFLKAAIETNPECIRYIHNPHRQQLYDLLSPLRVLSFDCRDAQDKLMRVITGLMTLSYYSPLRGLVGSNDRPHSSSNLNWIHDVSLKILGYLSVKDIVRLMQTPANVYVKESDGSERPCRYEDQPIETHQGDLGLFSWLFRKSEPRYQRTSEDEANKQRYLTSDDFKVLR